MLIQYFCYVQSKPAVPEEPKRSTLNLSKGKKRTPSVSPDRTAPRGLSTTGQSHEKETPSHMQSLTEISPMCHLVTLRWKCSTENEAETLRNTVCPTGDDRKSPSAKMLFLLLIKLLSGWHFCPLSSSCSAARAVGGQEEAVHESSSAGKAEEQHRAGQDFPPYCQRFRPNDWGGTQRQHCGHQHGEQTDLLSLESLCLSSLSEVESLSIIFWKLSASQDLSRYYNLDERFR